MEDNCTNKFLELLCRYDYVCCPDCEEKYRLHLSEENKRQFLKECDEFLEGAGELKAAVKLADIRYLYNEELKNISENAVESKFSWFSLADKLFQRPSTSTTAETSNLCPLRHLARSRGSMSDFQTLTQDDTSPSVHRILKEIRNGCKDTQVVLVKMDITKLNKVESARKVIEEKLGDKGLNLVINNAAALKMQGFPDITEENMLLHFSTNTVGPVNVVKEMLPLLQRSAARKSGGMTASRAVVLNISAMGGSITNSTDAQPRIFLSAMGYRISKAALNMAMRIISLTIKDQGILIVSMCPGWVKTDMGSDRASLTVEESVSSMLETLSQLNEEHHGTFMDRNGVISEF